MVSPLWKATLDGDLNRVKDILKDASRVEIEVKGALTFRLQNFAPFLLTYSPPDHTGVTPLIQAVRNGHVEIVRELLAHGADPNNASSQGRPDTYTHDPVILELLRLTPPTPVVNGVSDAVASSDATVPQEGAPQYDQSAAAYDQAMRNYWYMPPPNGMYPPYGGYMPPPPDGVQHPMPSYYPVPPPQGHPQQQQPQQPIDHQPSPDGTRPDGQLGQQQPQQQPQPPQSTATTPTLHISPDIARTIPCRYFPMCKYGPSCMFLHVSVPYFNGPPPPVHYPAGYEAIGHPPAFPPHPYYAIPPPQSYPPPPSSSTAGPHSPVQHTTHAPPAHPIPFTPEGAPPQVSQVPPPVPYPAPNYAPPPPQHPPHISISPTANFHPAVMPVQPSYPPPPVSPTHHRKESNSYTQPLVPAQHANGFNESNTLKPAPTYPEEGRNNSSFPRESYRRGGFRRTSFTTRKPPCAFFPAGKCKNGNDCRFPHVRPEDDPAAFGPDGYPPPSFPSRNRPRQPDQFPAIHHQKSFGSRDEIANGDGTTPANRPLNGGHANGFRKLYPVDHNGHPNGNFGHRGGYANGRHDKFGRNVPVVAIPTPPKEKVLSPADFPSLNGSVTPTTPINGLSNGLTAAQVLKGNTPSKDSAMTTPTDSLSDAMSKVTINGVNSTAKHAHQNGMMEKERSDSPDLPAPVFPSINDSVPSKLVAAA
ncbi:hypothetical protein FRB99_006658 [Tulasnella sp. 403]|nr:hypothetical protein FRB99_006658 [Tulasnella sp. 403]